MKRTIEIDLQYQPLIDGPPPQQGNLHEKAQSGDKGTVEKWRDTWISHYQTNHERFGTFQEKTIGGLFGCNRYKPAIVIGSGPSLKNCVDILKENSEMEHRLMTVSCLHNFGYFEDNGFHADYYLSLDSGSIVLKDISEGCQNLPGHYWEKTEGKVLLATVASDPELFEKWRGEVYIFNSLIPDAAVRKKYEEIEKFTHYVSSGGNALGACLYVAKAIFCSDVIHFVGADFCFDYNDQFHSYKTHYDQPGRYVTWPDVYGIPRKTWPSYLNFKFWFDHVASQVPGRWVNCSEGLMGAYKEGNIRQFTYMSLKDALIPFKMTQRFFIEAREVGNGDVVNREEVAVKDLFATTQYDKDLVLF